MTPVNRIAKWLISKEVNVKTKRYQQNQNNYKYKLFHLVCMFAKLFGAEGSLQEKYSHKSSQN